MALREVNVNIAAPGSAPGQAKKAAVQAALQPQAPHMVTVYKKSKTGATTEISFLQGQCLGKGAFATCYELTNIQTGEVFAGKITAKEKVQTVSQQNKLVMEAKIHRSLKHPHIVCFYNAYENEKHYYFILEKCNQRSLRDILRKKTRLNDTEVRYYMVQVLEALQYLKTQLVVHRDLKLDNIFLHENQVKLGDFGLACRLQNAAERKHTVCGTPNYISPEVLAKTGHGLEVDAWAVGVIIYSLLIGIPPFETKQIDTTYDRIKRNDYNFPDNIEINADAKNLIRRLLNPAPEKRPTIEEIIRDVYFRKSPIAMRVPYTNSSTMSFLANREPSAMSMAFAASTSSSIASTAMGSVTSSVSSINPSLISGSTSSLTNVLVTSGSMLPPPSTDRVLPQRTLRATARRVAEGVTPATALHPHPSFTTSGGLVSAQPTAVASGTLSPHKGSAFQATTQQKSPSVVDGADLPPAAGTRKRKRSESSDPAYLEPPAVRQQTSRSGSRSPQAATQPFSVQVALASAISGTDEVRSPHKRVRQNNLEATNTAHEFDEIAILQDRLKGIIDACATGASSPSSQHADNTSPGRQPTRSSTRLQKKRLGTDGDGAPVKHRWIVKWVDFSNQWGLGYQLSDGVVGVAFNCGSKMALSPSEPVIEFVQLQPRFTNAPIGAPENTYKKETLNADNDYTENPHIRKRVYAVRYTKRFLDGSNASPGLERIGDSTLPTNGLSFVQQWIRTQHGILFLMSDFSIQANFVDHTKLFVGSRAENMTYINTQAVATAYHRSEVVRSPEMADITQRLQYIMACVKKHFVATSDDVPPAN